MKTELEAKLHPNVSEDFLRSEYRYYQAYGQSYDEWLHFMHDEREGVLEKTQAITAKELLSEAKELLSEMAPTLVIVVPILAVWWTAVYFILASLLRP